MLSEWLVNRLRQAATIGLVVGVASGCSSSLFTGGKGTELDHLTNNSANFNPKCFEMNLSTPTLDVITTRQLVDCLNSNNSIPAYAALVHKMTDPQLQVLLNLVNPEILGNPTRLRLISQSWDQMGSKGPNNGPSVTDRAMSTVSKLLADGKFIRAALNLAKQGTHYAGSNQIDRAVLQSIHILADELTDGKSGADGITAARQNLDRILSTGSAMTSLKAYKALITGLSLATQFPANVVVGSKLNALVAEAQTYLIAKINDPKQAYGKIMAWGVADGSLFDGLDYFYNSECDGSISSCGTTLSENDQVAAMDSFMRLLTLDSTNVTNSDGTISSVSNREYLLKPMSSLFNLMDTQINCMGSTKDIPNGDMLVMNELGSLAPISVPQWVLGENAIKIKLANSLCTFPGNGDQTFNNLIGVLRTLAGYSQVDAKGNPIFGRPLISVAHFVKGLQIGDQTPMASEAVADLAPYLTYPQNERFRMFLVHFLGDVGSSGGSDCASNPNSFNCLTDTLAELSRSDREALANTLYLLNVPAQTPPGGPRPPVSREDLQKVTRILMKVRAKLQTLTAGVPGSAPLQGRSLYDVGMNAVLNVATSDLQALAAAVARFIGGPDDLLNPLSNVSREALLLNSANPLLEVAIDVARDAENKSQLFQTLFDISDTQEFEDAMALTATMAGNGQLKQLVTGTLTLFKGTINNASGEAVPADVAKVQLVDSSRDLAVPSPSSWTWTPAPASWPSDPAGVAACKKLDFHAKFGDTLGSSLAPWVEQMSEVGACANANNDIPELQAFVNYGVTASVVPGRPLMAWLVNLIEDLVPAGTDLYFKDIWDELTNLIIDPDYTDVKTMNSLLPFATGKRYCVQYDADVNDPTPTYSCPKGVEEVTFTQQLGRLSAVVKDRGADLQQLMNAGQATVIQPAAARAGLFAYDSYVAADDNTNAVVPDTKPPLESYPINFYSRDNNQNTIVTQQLDAMIQATWNRPATDADYQSITQSYWNQVNNFEDLHYADTSGKVHYGYHDANDLKTHIKRFLDELAVGTRMEEELAYFARFNSNPYTADWWADWFKRLSSEVRPISYYYPGQYPGTNTPTVRLVSNLDLLEMVVIESDFSMNELGQGLGFVFGLDSDANFSIKYLTMLAQSGKNMEPAIDAMEKELAFFGSVANGPLGGTLKPEVKRRLYNLHQVFHVLHDVDVEREYTYANGKKAMINDLGVLRDLFKDTLSATPMADRQNYHRDKNSLAFICQLVRSGALRLAGINIWHMNKAPNLTTLESEEDTDTIHRDVVPLQVAPSLKFLITSSVVRTATGHQINRGIRDILDYLLRQDCNHANPLYKTGCVQAETQWPTQEFNDRYVFLGKLIDEAFNVWLVNDDQNQDQNKPLVMDNIKRAAYNLVNLIDRLNYQVGADGSLTPDLVTPSLIPLVLHPILGTATGTAIIARHFDLLASVMTSPTSPHMLKLLWDAEKSDAVDFNALRSITPPSVAALAVDYGAPAASGISLLDVVKNSLEWDATESVFRWMRRDPDYLALKAQSIGRIYDEMRAWALRDDTRLKPRVQEFLGKHMANGDLVDLTAFIGNQSVNHSDTFANSLAFIGKYDTNTGTYPYVDKLNNFMDLLHDGVVENSTAVFPAALLKFSSP